MTGEATEVVFLQAHKVFGVAMHLARRGLSAEDIREAMADMARDAADHAVAWVEERERLANLADREDFADECMTEARREREAGQ